VTIITKGGTSEVPLSSKEIVADAVFDRVVELLGNGQNGATGAEEA